MANKPRRRWEAERRRRPPRFPHGEDAPDLARNLMVLARTMVPQGGDATPDDWQRAMTMASIAWNASALPDTLDHALTQVTEDEETRATLCSAIVGLRTQKDVLFPHDHRVVIFWELQPHEDGSATLSVRGAQVSQ